MGILTKDEILKCIVNESIIIRPFDLANLKANSYDLSIGDSVRIYVKDRNSRNYIESNYNQDHLTDYFYNDLFGNNRIGNFAINDVVLDLKKENITAEIRIPESGLTLQPGKVYLVSTKEYTETLEHVPFLNGRSSTGRLGLFVHVTAAFGDIGFKGKWTLELVPTQPIRIYPFARLLQISYYKPEGKITYSYNGKYQDSKSIIPSKMYEDYQK